MKVVEWRGKPVWILKRTPEMMASLKKTEDKVADPKSEKPYTMEMPDYCDKQMRSRKEHSDILVAVGICSHLVVHQVQNLQQAHSHLCRMTGTAAFYAHVMVLHLIWLVVYLRTSQHLKILMCRVICILSDTKIVIGKDEKGEA